MPLVSDYKLIRKQVVILESSFFNNYSGLLRYLDAVGIKITNPVTNFPENKMKLFYDIYYHHNGIKYFLRSDTGVFNTIPKLKNYAAENCLVSIGNGLVLKGAELIECQALLLCQIIGPSAYLDRMISLIKDGCKTHLFHLLHTRELKNEIQISFYYEGTF